MPGPMGPTDLQGHLWAGILFSASLLTMWSLPATAQLTLDANLVNTTQKLLAKPTITVSHDSVIEHKENVSFHCDTNDVNITIHWVSNNLPLVIHERMHLSADGKTLTILTVHREDFGTYQCKVQSGVQFQNSNLICLTVNYGPDTIEIKLQPGVPNGKVVEVMEGSTMIFSVETQSYPLPAFFWFLPNDSVQSSTITTFTIQLHPGNTRACISAWCPVMSPNCPTWVLLKSESSVFSERLTKTYIMSPSLDLMETSSSMALTCQTTQEVAGVQCFLRYQPLLPSERLVLSANNRTLAIRGLLWNDTGPYECEIWNWGSRMQSDPLKLTIHYGPDRVDITRGEASVAVSIVEVELNTSLTLNCRAESQPIPEYHWTFKHSTAMYTGEQLIIEALSQEHQGTYNCTVFNPLTHLTCSASVLVRAIGPQSSLPASTLAGIAVGILVIISLATGLGCFLYFRNTSRKTTEEPIHEAVTPTSEKEHPAAPNSYWSQHVYANVPEPQAWDGVQKKELASTTPRSYSHSDRKPSPKFLQPALAPTPPQGDTESDYEVLVNPECSIYYHIKPKV